MPFPDLTDPQIEVLETQINALVASLPEEDQLSAWSCIASMGIFRLAQLHSVELAVSWSETMIEGFIEDVKEDNDQVH